MVSVSTSFPLSADFLLHLGALRIDGCQVFFFLCLICEVTNFPPLNELHTCGAPTRSLHLHGGSSPGNCSHASMTLEGAIHSALANHIFLIFFLLNCHFYLHHFGTQRYDQLLAMTLQRCVNVLPLSSNSRWYCIDVYSSKLTQTPPRASRSSDQSPPNDQPIHPQASGLNGQSPIRRQILQTTPLLWTLATSAQAAQIQEAF